MCTPHCCGPATGHRRQRVFTYTQHTYTYSLVKSPDENSTKKKKQEEDINKRRKNGSARNKPTTNTTKSQYNNNKLKSRIWKKKCASTLFTTTILTFDAKLGDVGGFERGSYNLRRIFVGIANGKCAIYY